jgi:transcriptional regulator with XRE-family HTH domain
MGYAQPRPKHLAAKLLQIRQGLGLSQPKLAKVLGVRDYSDISNMNRIKTNRRSLCCLPIPAPQTFQWRES